MHVSLYNNLFLKGRTEYISDLNIKPQIFSTLPCPSVCPAIILINISVFWISISQHQNNLLNHTYSMKVKGVIIKNLTLMCVCVLDAGIKKTILVRYTDLWLTNVEIKHLVNFLIILRIKVNIWLVLSYLYSFGVQLCLNSTECILFMPKMLIFVTNILKCSDFIKEISGILDFRILTFCKSD